MADPDNAPDTLAREELGLDPGELGSPVKAAAGSCSAFAVGAAVPLVPYLLASQGTMLGGPKPFARKARSLFLQKLDELVNAVLREG